MSEVAEVNIAYFLGEAAATAIFPVAGLILLIVGLRQRSRARQLPQGYPPAEPSDGSLPPPDEPAPPEQPQYYPSPTPRLRPQGWSIALIVVGSLLLGGGLLQIIRDATDLVPSEQQRPPSVKAGECISQSDLQAHNMRPTPQKCDSPDSIWETASTGGGSATCPDGKLRDSQYAVLFDKTTTLCFMLNLKQGQCYSLSGSAESPIFTEATCDASGSVMQVVKRIDGDYHRSLCPEETEAIFYLSPARLYCLQPLKS